MAPGKRLDRCVTDSLDLDDRDSRYRLSLRMSHPFPRGSQHRGTHAPAGQRLLQFVGPAFGHRRLDRFPYPIVAGVDDLQLGQHAGPVMSEVAVELDQPAVGCAVVPGSLIPCRGWGLPVHLEEALAAKSDGGMTTIDRNRMVGASAEQLGRRQLGGSDHTRGQLGHVERGR